MIVLASKSPRRRELIHLISDDVRIVSAQVDEALPDGISPSQAVLYLSEIKARPFADEKSDDIVIGADTVVAANGEILGKPADDKDAYRMLKMLSGREHSVFTGVTLLKGSSSVSFFCETKVEFFDLSDSEIKDYIATGEPSDKAGAYGIQGRGALLVKKTDGDFFNVVGLPVGMLAREIKKLG